MQSGPVDRLQSVAVERPGLEQLEVEVGRVLATLGEGGPRNLLAPFARLDLLALADPVLGPPHDRTLHFDGPGFDRFALRDDFQRGTPRSANADLGSLR